MATIGFGPVQTVWDLFSLYFLPLQTFDKTNDYVVVIFFRFMTDFEGWMELCDLSQLDYSKACYCMEELIMSNPHNNLFYQALHNT
jgi:hypothetical protein